MLSRLALVEKQGMGGMTLFVIFTIHLFSEELVQKS